MERGLEFGNNGIIDAKTAADIYPFIHYSVIPFSLIAMVKNQFDL
jgi:hypothetical protein